MDYSVTSVKGYPENFGAIGLTIQEALEDYRTANDGAHAPQRSFRGLRYAATRVDAVGHSMGGQIARLYASDLTGQVNRGGQWPPGIIGARTDSNSEGRFMFLRAANWGAGDFRRLVTIGSPFQGSPIANAVNDVFEPPSSLAGFMLRDAARTHKDSLPFGLAAKLWDDNDNYVPPTAIADLRIGSPAQILLENASYPTGHKRVAWTPIIGIGSQWDHATETLAWELLFSWLPFVPSNAFEIEELNPTMSDLVVSAASQRNGLLNVPVDRIFEFHIHTGIADPIGDAIFGQTTSPLISDKIGNLLSRPRFDFLENGLDR